MLQTNNDIDFHLAIEILIEEVIEQLEKDIHSAGEHYTFKSIKTEELVNELEKYLSKIDLGQRLDNLLYRIDVDLKKIDPKLSHYNALSIAIWNREFQKVWIRKTFKIGSK